MDPKENPNPFDEANDNPQDAVKGGDSSAESEPKDEQQSADSDQNNTETVDQNDNNETKSDTTDDASSDSVDSESEQSSPVEEETNEQPDESDESNESDKSEDKPDDSQPENPSDNDSDSVSSDTEEEPTQANSEESAKPEENSANDDQPEETATPTPVAAAPVVTESKAATPQTPAGPDNHPIVGSVAQPKTKMTKRIPLIITGILLLALAAFGLTQFGADDTPSDTPVVKNEIPLLRISVQDGPLNEFYDMVQNDGSTFVNFQMYEGLVTYDNVNQIVPLLATSWTNPDDETWLFTLKNGVSFHNGEAMTAEDVKYSIEQRATVSRGDLAPKITAVEIVDPATIKITTDGPDPLLLSDLALVFIVDDETAEADQPAGTGPYVVDSEEEPTAKKVRLTAFNSYHDGQVYTRALDIQQLSNEDAVEAFNEGEIDIASGLVSDYEDIDEAIANSTVLTNDFSIAFIGLNGKAGSPLADEKVREAIMLSINPETIIEEQEVQGRPEAQFITKDIPGFNPNITRPDLNIVRAQELLAEAGFPKGFRIELSYASSNNKGMFNSVKQQLSEIGITVVEDFWGDDAEGFFGKVFSDDLETAFLAYTPDILDGSDPYGTLFSEAGIIENPVAGEVSSLLDQAAQTLDETERLALLQEIGQKLSDNFVSVPLYSRDAVTALSGPFVINRDLPSGITGVKFYKVYLP